MAASQNTRLQSSKRWQSATFEQIGLLRRRKRGMFRGMQSMKKFWMSGEIQADVDASFMKAMNIVEAELNGLLEGVPLGDKVEQWAFIATIREEDHPIYNEIVKKSSRGKVLEFRLKIPHREFASAHPAEQIRLILTALGRSVILMGNLGVSIETQNALQSVLFRAEKHLTTGE